MRSRSIPAFLPMVLDTAIEADAQFVGHNGDLMTTLGIRGHDQATGEPIAFIACDVATQVRPPQSKQDQELRDVEECLKYLLSDRAGPQLCSVQTGPDANRPPDVIAALSDGPLACEAVQLHLPALDTANNRPASRQARFDNLCSELIKQSATVNGQLKVPAGGQLKVPTPCG